MYNRDYYIQNKKKINKQKKQWIINNRDKHNKYQRKSTLKRLYGITLEQYNKIFDKQEGRCAICNVHQSELKQSLSVDHNHNTGETRGLLCYKCNSIIGYSNEDLKILKQIIKYLKIYK